MEPKSTVFESWITVAATFALAAKCYQAALLTDQMSDWIMFLVATFIFSLFAVMWIQE